MKKYEAKCLLDPTGGACRGGEEARAKRQVAAQGQTNTNTQVQGGGLQVQTQSQTQTSGGATPLDVDVDSFIKPFHDCVRNCTKNDEPATVVSGSQAAEESVVKHMRGIETCSVKLRQVKHYHLCLGFQSA